MKKKVIAVLAAAVLAVLGVAVLGAWAMQADARAYDGAKLVKVVQVTKDVPAGATALELSKSITMARLPRSAVPADAVTRPTSIVGKVTTTDLKAGEILLSTRIAEPGATTAGTTTKGGVPEGKQEISLALDKARSGGGEIKPGDTVGVLLSFPTEGSTQMGLNRVPVTRISGGDAASNDVLVTLAVSSKQAEMVANAAEFGKVWLTQQNDDTDTDTGKGVTTSAAAER